ncbi:MAG TPA: AbrB/MazE/SpoVT family DNA-binding domain-containing protein [Allosphingosinicella sp.]|jgi:antitoxin MazE
MKVAKWGNSLAIRIPKDVAEALGINEGDEVQLSPADKPVIGIARQMTREEALERLDRFQGLLPPDYKFKRSDAYGG